MINDCNLYIYIWYIYMIYILLLFSQVQFLSKCEKYPTKFSLDYSRPIIYAVFFSSYK